MKPLADVAQAAYSALKSRGARAGARAVPADAGSGLAVAAAAPVEAVDRRGAVAVREAALMGGAGAAAVPAWPPGAAPGVGGVDGLEPALAAVATAEAGFADAASCVAAAPPAG